MPSFGQQKRGRRLLMILVGIAFLFIGTGLLLIIFLSQADEQGSVSVISVPEGAGVLLDGKTISKPTPVVIPISEVGRPYEISVSMKNYKPFQRTITFSEGENRIQVLAVLTPIFGRLEIRTIPPGADIYIDNTHRGQTPATIENMIPSNEINLELRKRGFKPIAEVIQWEGQSFLSREFTLSPSP